MDDDLFVCSFGDLRPMRVSALVEVLDRRPGAETHPAFSALREGLHEVAASWLTGWWVLATEGGSVYFASGQPPTFAAARCELSDGNWQMRSFAEQVGFERYRAGSRRADWYPVGRPSPDATSIDLLVHERSCASGRSAEGRIEPPLVDYGEGAVSVAMFVRPLGGRQRCPGNPRTPFRLELQQRLGDRVLLDSGTYPARPVVEHVERP
jgi:hypothetical protein